MNEEEKFDELLNSKLSEREFPFDELNWDEAERLIIKQERWRKIFPIALIFSAGVVAGIAIMLLLIPNAHNTLPNTEISKSTTNLNTVNPTTVTPANKPKENVPQSIQSNVNTTLPVQAAFVKKSTKAIGRDTSANNTPIITKTLKEHHMAAIVSLSKSQHKLSYKSKLLASVNETIGKSGHGEVRMNNEPNPSETGTNASSSQAKNNSTVESGISSNNTDETEKSTAINAIVEDKNNSNNNGATNNTIAKNNTQSDKRTLAKDTTSKTRKDSNKANGPPALPPLSPPKSAPGDYAANILSVYAGGDYSLGWSDNGEKEANGITPFGGFNFTHYFTSNVSGVIGVGYSELNNLNKTYASSNVQYDFGANSSITAVTPQTVCYLTFPLTLQYNFDSKDKISAGIEYLLLLTTSSAITTYKQNYFTKTQAGSEIQNGYTQGFSNSDLQCVLSYTRMLTFRLGIGMEFYHGFGYIENNSIPGINQYEKNNGFRFVLSYQLMK